MKKEKASQSIFEEKTASLDEVRAAIDALTPAELLRLEKYARWRVEHLGARSRGRNHEDLLQDALVTMLAGKRHWKIAAVDFLGQLLGAIRSISTHWGEQFDADQVLESEAMEMTPEGGEPNRLLGVPLADPECMEAAKQEINRIQRRFADDPLIHHILEGFRQGMRGREIQTIYGISEMEYKMAVKRMRRALRLNVSKGASRHG